MLHRAWRADLDLSEAEGRIISGIAVPFDSPTTIAERGMVFEETFKAGSTRDSIAKRGDRIKLLAHHDAHAYPIGVPVSMEDTKRGMAFAAKVSDTSAGNDALVLVRDKAIDGFSVGFSVPEGGDSWSSDGSQRTIHRAEIHEVSLVNFPAYDRARVDAIRSARGDDGSAGPHSYTEPHQFNDIVGTGLCGVCNLTADDGNHISQDAANLDLEARTADILVMQHRLDVLRLEAINF